MNDPIIKNPAMQGRRWSIDYAHGPHTSYGKLSKRQVDEFSTNNMDTRTDINNNDVDITYNEFYEELTGGVGDSTDSHDVDPIELAWGQFIEMEHTKDPNVATEIALDHLSEDPKYYSKLKKAGLAKELDQLGTSTGFGDPDHPINNEKRVGSNTATVSGVAGHNIAGKIGNTPNDSVNRVNDKTSADNKNLNQMNNNDFTVDVNVEEPALDEDRCTDIAKRKYEKWPSAYACVPERNTQALTKNGWKSVMELNLGDEILTHNLKLDILEFKPILNIHRYKNADTITVQSGNNGFVFESTKNHKWVIKLPQLNSDKSKKFERINSFSLIETEEILKHKHDKLLVVTAPYENGTSIKKNKIYKYGDNWVEYILNIDPGQRQSWLFSAIVYDGNQQKTQRLTDNINNLNKLEWNYDGNHEKQSFGFKQKDIMHRDAFLLSAFLNSGITTWKKSKAKEIYSCHYTANERYKNTDNFKLISENKCDVWCPETENGTWVMKQEINNNGIITITGNSGAVVRCRKGKIWKKTQEEIEQIKKELKEDFSKEKKQGLHGWFARRGGKGGKGWVDCNTCRKNTDTGKKTCKSCGRQAGEKRSKYPACRPTPGQCNKTGTSRKKGPSTVSWKKKIKENSEMAQSDLTKIIDYSEKLQSMFSVNDNLEDWVKAKLNHACDYVATVKDYLKFYKDEKETVGEINSSMSMGALKQLNSDAKELQSMFQSNNQLEDWLKAKLNLAGEYLDDVYHHLDHFGSSGRKYDNVKNSGHISLSEIADKILKNEK
jgi:hypothetical protein